MSSIKKASTMSTSAVLLVILLILPPSALCVPITDGIIGSRGNILFSGDRLNTNEALTNDNLVLRMQDDCNLVLYDTGNPVWASQTYNQGTGCYLQMQYDGNLVLFDSNGIGHWAATDKSLEWGNYVAVLQKDRRVVIYGGARWSLSM